MLRQTDRAGLMILFSMLGIFFCVCPFACVECACLPQTNAKLHIITGEEGKTIVLEQVRALIHQNNQSEW